MTPYLITLSLKGISSDGRQLRCIRYYVYHIKVTPK